MADLNAIHKHHIVPRYKCEELGINPDFDDNFIDTTRKQHALIHWGYYCNDLSPLLEVCSPEQWVLDMIPLGDKRDVGASQLIALGEVDGIDSSGENNPNYKHGEWVDRQLGMKIYRNRPEYKEQRKEWDKKYRNRPEYKEERKVYDKKYYIKNKEEISIKIREYYIKNKEKINAKARERYARKKLEKATATLDNFM